MNFFQEEQNYKDVLKQYYYIVTSNKLFGTNCVINNIGHKVAISETMNLGKSPTLINSSHERKTFVNSGSSNPSKAHSRDEAVSKRPASKGFPFLQGFGKC